MTKGERSKPPKKPAAPKKPARRSVGPYKLAAIRGPREDGRFYWRAREHKDGTEQTVWTGWGTVREADEAVGAILTGQVPPDPTACSTVADLLSLWHGSIEGRSDLSKLTVRGYGDSANRVKATIGTVSITRLERGTVERHRDTSLKAGRTPRGVLSDLKALRLAWRWGREMGLTPNRELPIAALQVPFLNHERPPTETMMATIAKFPPVPRMHALLLAGTAARRIEIAQLRHCDVTERGERLWVALRGKGGRFRSTPLHHEVESELRAWIVAHPGEPQDMLLGYTAQTCIQYLHRAIHAAGATWTPHDLRRLAVDTMYRAGVDIAVCAQLAGHSPAVALREYRRVSEKDMIAVVDKVALGSTPREAKVMQFPS